MISVQALVVANVRGVQDRKGQTRKAAYVDFVRRQPSGGVDRVVAGGFNVRKLLVPAVMSLAAAHGEHLGHGVVDGIRVCSQNATRNRIRFANGYVPKSLRLTV